MTFNKIKQQVLKPWTLFLFFLSLLIIDRIITLCYFGFNYTDVDQVMLWNGAVDYSNGIFHQPYFYGQAYNYMLEAILATPLILANVEPSVALPIITSLMSLVPYIVLALFFIRKDKTFWACFSLALPILLPIEYNFITTISRGFIQAHLFIPLLFIPFFNPTKSKNISLFYMSAGLCFILNQSSLLLIVPIYILLLFHNYKSYSFYLKLLWVIPFLIVDAIAKYYYILNPESVTHELMGLTLDFNILIESLSHLGHFDYLFPFSPYVGSLYLLAFGFLLFLTVKNKNKEASLFILFTLIFILLTFTIPKVQKVYTDGGIFFNISRLYLSLPLLLILVLFLVFKQRVVNYKLTFILIILTITSFTYKTLTVKEAANLIFQNTAFPAIKVNTVSKRNNELKELIKDNDIDLIVSAISSGWEYIIDGYAFYPLEKESDKRKVISLLIEADRRTWLYNDNKIYSTVLLNGYSFPANALNTINREIISSDQILITNNTYTIKELLAKIKLEENYLKNN